MQDEMNWFRKCSLKNSQGSAMLVVIIIMTIVFLMSSIIFGYSLKSYKRTLQLNDYKKSQLMTESGLNESVYTLLERIDTADIIETYTISNSSPFVFDTNYSYETKVSEDGFYAPADYIPLGNVKTLVVKRSVFTAEELTFGNIAMEIKGLYKEASYTKRVLITINTTADDYFEINIYKCR